jgi:hypothetical protein
VENTYKVPEQNLEKLKAQIAKLAALPPFIGGIDTMGQHKTVADLAFRVRHEMDLATEGEPNEIKCARQTDTTKRWSKCRAFLLRCKATTEAPEEQS